MAKTNQAKMKEKEDELKIKKREYDKRRREAMKNDPVQAELMKEKERAKYKKKLQTKKIKLAKDMTPRELRVNRKMWREKFRKWYQNNKTTPVANQPSLPPDAPTSTTPTTPRAQHIALIAKRRVWWNHKRLEQKVQKLEEENEKLKRKTETLRKRVYRERTKQQNMNSTKQSPRKAVDKLLENGSFKDIRKKLLVGESLNHGLKNMYHRMNDKNKTSFRLQLQQNATFLRKYKLLNGLNFMSSKMFYRNFLHRSNNRVYRNRCHQLADQVKRDVVTFFEDDEHSALCPGKKDCITRRGIKKQKRYMTGNLKSLHQKFCNSRAYKLSYSTFCKLRPFWVVTPKVTARDTCMCKTHDNMNELTSSLRKMNVLYSGDINEILSSICCDRSSISCLERKCGSCKDLQIPYQPFENGEITYYQWVSKTETYSTGKGLNPQKKTAKHVVKDLFKSTILETVDLFEKKIKEYMNHESIVIHQFRSVRNLKSRLMENEVLIHCDFSENYNTKYGREIQSVHFGGSRKQVTLHTVQIYFRKTASDPCSSQAFCTLSESMEHGPAAVWAHLSPIFNFIKKNLPQVNTFHFLSDSPATQYRNKTIFFLIAHALPTTAGAKLGTWNYSASGHGKGAVDGIGGCLKRTADRIVACGKDLNSFGAFFKALKENVKNVELIKITNEDISGVARRIPPALPTFKGTMSVHQVIFDSSKQSLKMNSLSSFNCYSCKKFTIGFHSITASPIITEDSIVNDNDGDNQNVDDGEHQGYIVPTNQNPCQEPSSVQILESQILENQNEREILKPQELSNRRGRLCFTCGGCIRTNSVECDLCAKVYHRKCSNIQEDDAVPFFVCDACLI